MDMTLKCLAPGAQVSESGFYRMTAEQYHADPCVEPSLSSSIAKLLIDKSPRHAWQAHARFGAGEKDTSAAMDLGSLVGKFALGCGPEFVVLEYDDYKKQAARDERDAAIAAGKIPVLGKMVVEADAIADKITARIRESEAPYIFDADAQPQGHAELVACWQEDGIWCRAMFDWLVPGRYEVDDLKVTGADLSPRALGRKIADMGYEVQQAFYVRGLEKLLPDSGGRWKFRFVFAESDAPHEVVIIENDATARAIGKRKVNYALAIWRMCIGLGNWPGYGPKVFTADYPQWSEAAWLTREETDPSFAGVSL